MSVSLVSSPGPLPAAAAIVALGSNLGESARLIREAMERLRPFSQTSPRCSSLWRSSPVDCPPGSADFINAVAAILPLPDETPESLLEKLQALEREFGRRRTGVLNEPRPLDLDLIAFGAERRNGTSLILPHPRAHERRFVLEPLCELDPQFQLPGQSKTVTDLAAALRFSGAESLARLDQ